MDSVASQHISEANHLEQDKARAEALKPEQRSVNSSLSTAEKNVLVFPVDDICWQIQRVVITTGAKDLSLDFLQPLAQQSEAKCLGRNGITFLANKLQNELIRRGYITSYINTPSQDLRSGILKYKVNPGRVGDIELTTDSHRYLTLNNSLPFSHGDVLNLRDLEQAAENLQRIPGTSANIQVLPGKEDGFSDISIARQQDTFWQAGLWMNDAGSRYTGRYQGGAVLYAYNPTTLNDILYVSGSHDLEFEPDSGNKSVSVGYSIPWGYWSLDLYANRSDYLQSLSGNWGALPFRSKYQYASAELSRVLSHTQTQRTSASLKLFKGTSRYFLDDVEIGVMRKQTPGWKLSLMHQRYFEYATVGITAGFQDRFNMLASSKTPEEEEGMVSSHARIATLDIEALVQSPLTGPDFSYAPHLSLQYSPDELTQQNRFSAGNRWSVRGFDGENSLVQNSGGYLANTFTRRISGTQQNIYLGLDVGGILEKNENYKGRVIAGGVVGIKGRVKQINYDLFAGGPFYKPGSFTADSLTSGFSLQWLY